MTETKTTETVTLRSGVQIRGNCGWFRSSWHHLDLDEVVAIEVEDVTA